MSPPLEPRGSSSNTHRSPIEPHLAAAPRYPDLGVGRPNSTAGRYPSNVAPNDASRHPYARLSSHREVSLQVSQTHQTSIRVASSQETRQALQPLRSGVNGKVVNEANSLQQQTLHKPKSKLRLRLKLTPPHPPGTRLLVPDAPLPRHISNQDAALARAVSDMGLSRTESGNGKDKENAPIAPKHPFAFNDARDAAMSLGKRHATTGHDYPPIQEQARAHQDYQRGRLETPSHGRNITSSTSGHRRVPSSLTTDERVKAVEEAHLRRPAPSPPKEPVFTINNQSRSSEQPRLTKTLYHLDPTPAVSPLRVEGHGFQPITSCSTPVSANIPHPSGKEDRVEREGIEQEASSISLSLTVSQEDSHVFELDGSPEMTEEQKAFGKQSHPIAPILDDQPLESGTAAAQDTSRVDQSWATNSEQQSLHTREIDTVRDSSLDVSDSREDCDNTCWTSTTADDSGMVGEESKDKEGEGKKTDAEGMSDVFSLSDQMLADRFKFLQEIGFGNWGSVWSAKPRHADYHPSTRHESGNSSLPPIPAAIRAQHHPEKVAVKLVYRKKDPTTAARIRALWSEMKVIRTLREDPHPSIVGFDSFIITPSYALVIMPYLSHLMPVDLPEETVRPYFLQLTSAVAYLHDHGITHNDIKPANILLSHADVPVFVDFGFAQRWDLRNSDGRGPTAVSGLAVASNKAGSRQMPFWSEISWGTPEYLDPPRASGQWHDERLSDVWALGITFFEILTGRTPFEAHASEDFSTQEQLQVYYDRTVLGEWLGEWEMSQSMERLLKAMICPDHQKRLTASQAHRHAALQSRQQNDQLSTPPFVRTATTDRRAKKRREPQPKAKDPPKAVEAVSAPSPPKVEAVPVQARPITPPRASTPMKASTKHRQESDNVEDQGVATQSAVFIVTPKKEAPSTALMAVDPTKVPASPKLTSSTSHVKAVSSLEATERKEVDARANCPTRPRNNAMNVIEGLEKVKALVQSVEDLSVTQGVPSVTPNKTAQLRTIKSYDVLRRQPASGSIQQTNFDDGTSDVQPKAFQMRRPASAMALRNHTRDILSASPTRVEKQASTAGKHSPTRPTHEESSRKRCVSVHRRHTRVVSEGCLRALMEPEGKQLLNDIPNYKESADLDRRNSPKSSPTMIVKPAVSRDKTQPALAKSRESIIRHDAEKIVRFQEVATIDPAALEDRLDEIASWVKSVEQIVLEARTALEEVQQDHPRPKTPIDMERPASRMSNLINRRSVDNFVRLARDAQTSEVLSGPTAAPTHRPSMSMEAGSSNRLKRQRSDLTNFRSMQFQPIVEHELPESTPTFKFWSSGKAASNGLERKLRSHRSTGDLNKMTAMAQDPYEDILADSSGASRHGDGWSSSRHKGKTLFNNYPAKQGEQPSSSRFKNFIRGVFKR